MKKFLLIPLLMAAIFSAKAQSKLFLELDPKLGSDPFSLGAAVAQDTYFYKISRLEYYVSQISVTHDGGQVTPITDTFLLVRPALKNTFDLGEHPEINNVEAVKFFIGIDTSHNHLDPANWPNEHPLALQNPSMHWGWQGGYRFMVVEGNALTDSLPYFELHSIGDVNYRFVKINTPAETGPTGKTIRLNANYAGLLKGLNLTSGISAHGTTGEIVNLVKNTTAFVFSAKTATQTEVLPIFSGKMTIAPNPAQAGQIHLGVILPIGFDYRILATDSMGRVVFDSPVSEESVDFFQKKEWVAGIYFIQLFQNGRAVAVEKLLVY